MAWVRGVILEAAGHTNHLTENGKKFESAFCVNGSCDEYDFPRHLSLPAGGSDSTDTPSSKETKKLPR